MASVMGICGGLVGPKTEHVEKVLVFLVFFEESRGPRGRQSREQVSEPRGFGRHLGAILHTLGSLWNHFRYMSVDLESLWSVFKIYSFFQ